jgi:hypothetical protein
VTKIARLHGPLGSAPGLIGIATLALGLAACGPGSQRERVIGDTTLDAAYVQVDELEALLWPKTTEHWRPLSERQQLALEDLVTSLLRHAQRGGMNEAQRRRAADLAKTAGMELHTVTLEHEGWVEPVWVLVEPTTDRCGRGSYVFRIGELSREAPRTEYLLEAPHVRYDRYTGIIALSLFAEADTRPARALFANSIHRYAQADGSRDRRELASENPADATHREDHPLARTTARVLEDHKLALVQLHGFEQDAEANDPDVIIGSGRHEPSSATSGTLDRLRAAFPEFTIGHFGVDTARLGATTNVQARASRDARRCFVHIEASEAVREELRTDREARRRFAKALFDSGRQEFRGGCR